MASGARRGRSGAGLERCRCDLVSAAVLSSQLPRTIESLAATKFPPFRAVSSRRTLEAPREERSAAAQRDGRDVHDDFVQEPGVRRTDPPGRRRPRSTRCGRRRRRPSPRATAATSALVKAIAAPGTIWKLPVCEDPARDVAGPLPLSRGLVRELVVEDPLVRRRSHREGADAREELGVVQRSGRRSLVAREQPVERVIIVGDEPVERRRRCSTA